MLTNFLYSDYVKEQINEILEEKSKRLNFRIYIRR